MTTQQLSDVTTALRTLVDLRRVSQDSRTNWITVVGRTRQVEAASELVQSLDRAAGEVMLEFQVWEVDTNRARDLGILPPQPFSLVYLGPPVVNLLSAVASSAAAATPLSLLNWGQLETLYGVQIPGLTAFLNSSTNLVRFQQVLHLRATNGEEASLLLGTRVPVITGIVSSVIESPGGPPTNIIENTQGFIPNIQYEDTGVVVHATPHFHADGEMTLQLDFALRALGPTEANGIPSFTNREVINQVRLGYGEAYLIGGILNRTDQKAVTGYPWLSRIPVLRWLFSHEAKASTETELLILVKPTILRVAAADQIASRSIFFGKELTGLPAAVAPPPQPVAPQPGFPVQPGANQPGQPTQPGAPQPTAPTSAEPGVQPYIGQPVQPVTPGQPVPFPGRAFPQGAPQPFPGQQQPYQQQQPPAVNNPEQ